MSFMMKELLIKIKKGYLFLPVFLCISIVLLSFTFFRTYSQDQRPSVEPPGLRVPANVRVIPVNPYVIPANTQLFIPAWALGQYQLSQQQGLYNGSVLDFLISYYGTAAPSGMDADEDTYYIPLNIYDSEEDVSTPVTAMVDVTRLTVEEPSSSPEQLKVRTIEDIDRRQAPAVPDPKPIRNLNKTYPVSCDKKENKTEAGAPCVECISAKLSISTRQVKGFLRTVDRTVQSFGKRRGFSAAIKNFCNTCGVDIKDFVDYAEERSEKEKVPPEIIFGIMLRESNGDCNARGPVDSKGLLQMNERNSTALKSCTGNRPPQVSPAKMKRVCLGGKYRREGNYKRSYRSLNPRVPFIAYDNPYPEARCLNNPYCNFEESIHLLKGEKWYIGNRRRHRKPNSELKSWGEMDSAERHKWRNAIIAYNGAVYVKPAERAMKRAGVSSATLDDWEKKRIFFIRQYLRSGTQKRKNLIHNLAYVERIAGRETPDGFANSSICQWTQFRKNNPNLSCEGY